ncbi:MAG: hypothetical protein F4026_05430 [Synechococcus sp. SB0669_bin_8]|nr:hypothetical protein [Synechococcus sp. SB0675_bin_6]MYK91575.1 hypothetical protein [Synechococcus sp. SB0669_bin_8]
MSQKITVLVKDTALDRQTLTLESLNCRIDTRGAVDGQHGGLWLRHACQSPFTAAPSAAHHAFADGSLDQRKSRLLQRQAAPPKAVGDGARQALRIRSRICYIYALTGPGECSPNIPPGP